MSIRALVLAVVVAYPSLPYAWNPSGHRTIARIAQANLTSEASSRVRRILHGHDLASVASWADEDGRAHPERRPLHFAHFHSGSTFNSRTDCREGCLEDALWEFVRVLETHDSPSEDEWEALAYIVHLVGDAHQPFHAGRPGDHGGNDIKLDTGETLHQAFDQLPTSCDRSISARDGKAPQKGAQDLLPSTQLKASQLSTSEQWLNESHVISEAVYSTLRRNPDGTYHLPEASTAARCTMTRQRLELAGLRLAEFLNASLR